eukprot:scaffold11928_cov98-Cylindrotheca_fusiformis.AAC.3
MMPTAGCAGTISQVRAAAASRQRHCGPLRILNEINWTNGKLIDRGLVINASDLSECWSKLSLNSDGETAFERFTKDYKAKRGLFFFGNEDDISLPLPLDSVDHTYDDHTVRSDDSSGIVKRTEMFRTNAVQNNQCTFGLDYDSMTEDRLYGDIGYQMETFVFLCTWRWTKGRTEILGTKLNCLYFSVPWRWTKGRTEILGTKWKRLYSSVHGDGLSFSILLSTLKGYGGASVVLINKKAAAAAAA